MKLKSIFLLLFISGAFSSVAQPDPSVFEALEFRFIGPEGNRAIAIAGVPGDPMVSYIGAASGGLWKTTDGGAPGIQYSMNRRHPPLAP